MFSHGDIGCKQTPQYRESQKFPLLPDGLRLEAQVLFSTTGKFSHAFFLQNFISLKLVSNFLIHVFILIRQEPPFLFHPIDSFILLFLFIYFSWNFLLSDRVLLFPILSIPSYSIHREEELFPVYD